MKKLVLLTTLACAILLFGSDVFALSIYLEPKVTQYILPGESIGFDIKVAGLGEFDLPSLGAFDMEILFNPDVLEYVDGSLVFGSLLGDNPFFQWLDGPYGGPEYGGIAYDALRIQEVSLESADWLNALQPDSFILASLEFSAFSGCGHSYIIPDNIFLSDEWGNSLDIDHRGIGSVNVVPEPASIWMLGIGMLMSICAFSKRMLGRKMSAQDEKIS